jgi:hypothetical protein
VILAAALLVLVALGLFVGGIVTGLTAMYWACVAVSAVAAVLLVLARRQLSRPAAVRTRSAVREEAHREFDAPGPAAREPARTSVLPAQPVGEPVEHRAEPAGRWAEPEKHGYEPAENGYEPASEPDEQAEESRAAPPRHASPAADVARGGATAAGASSRHAGGAAAGGGAEDDPPVEEVEVTDLLLVVDLHDDVVVVDEHPRYHLPDCRFLAGRTGIPLPMDEARTDGFTPCGLCSPDRHMAEAERARRAGRRAE